MGLRVENRLLRAAVVLGKNKWRSRSRLQTHSEERLLLPPPHQGEQWALRLGLSVVRRGRRHVAWTMARKEELLAWAVWAWGCPDPPGNFSCSPISPWGLKSCPTKT